MLPEIEFAASFFGRGQRLCIRLSALTDRRDRDLVTRSVTRIMEQEERVNGIVFTHQINKLSFCGKP